MPTPPLPSTLAERFALAFAELIAALGAGMSEGWLRTVLLALVAGLAEVFAQLAAAAPLAASSPAPRLRPAAAEVVMPQGHRAPRRVRSVAPLAATGPVDHPVVSGEVCPSEYADARRSSLCVVPRSPVLVEAWHQKRVLCSGPSHGHIVSIS